VPDARDQGFVAVLIGPLDRFELGFAGMQNMVGMILNYIIGDGVALRSPFGARLDINIRHSSSS
jgi:hypothetical protein